MSFKSQLPVTVSFILLTVTVRIVSSQLSDKVTSSFPTHYFEVLTESFHCQVTARNSSYLVSQRINFLMSHISLEEILTPSTDCDWLLQIFVHGSSKDHSHFFLSYDLLVVNSPTEPEQAPGADSTKSKNWCKKIIIITKEPFLLPDSIRTDAA